MKIWFAEFTMNKLDIYKDKNTLGLLIMDLYNCTIKGLLYCKNSKPATLDIMHKKDANGIQNNAHLDQQSDLGFHYRISSVIRQSFFLPKQSQRSQSIL